MSTDRSKDRLADPAEHLPLHPADRATFPSDPSERRCRLTSMSASCRPVCARFVIHSLGDGEQCILPFAHEGDCRAGILQCEVSDARSFLDQGVVDLRCLRRARYVDVDGTLACHEHVLEADKYAAAQIARDTRAVLIEPGRTCQRCGQVRGAKLDLDHCPRCGLLADVPPGSQLAHRARWPIGGRWQRIGRHSHERSRSLWMRVLGLGEQIELCAGPAGEGAVARIDSTHPRFDALRSVLHWAKLAAGEENRNLVSDAHAAESEPRWTRARQARLDAGYSVDLVARLARIDAGLVDRIESRLQRPSVGELHAIGAVLGVHAGWLEADRLLPASPPLAPSREGARPTSIMCPRCGMGTLDSGCCDECGLPRALGRPHRAGSIGGLGVAALIGAPVPVSSQICPCPPGSGWRRIGRLDASRTKSLWVRVSEDSGCVGSLDVCAGPLGASTARVERGDPGFEDLARVIDLAIDASASEDSDGAALLREAFPRQSRLRKARLISGLSIDRLAHLVGMDPHDIARMDARRKSIPARAAISIGAIVDADPVWLADDLSTSTVSS